MAMGYINSFNALGQMLAMLLGGIMAEKISPQAPFFLAAGVAALALLLGTGIVEKKESREPMKIRELLLVGRDKNVLIPSALAVLVQLITFASVYGFTPIAAQKIGANEMQTGLLTTLSTLPGILASAMSGSVFARKYGERKTLTLGFLAMALSCAVIPSIKNLVPLYLSQMVGGFARGAIFSLLMSLSIQSVIPHKRATAMGFFQAIYGLGMFLGPILVGIISDLLGLSWGFWIVALMGTIAALLAYILVKPSYD